jgi:hypothetical protein
LLLWFESLVNFFKLVKLKSFLTKVYLKMLTNHSLLLKYTNKAFNFALFKFSEARKGGGGKDKGGGYLLMSALMMGKKMPIYVKCYFTNQSI